MIKSTPIVIQLQELAADSSNDISDLLRKALLIATKLKLDEFRVWVMKELNGYQPGEELPSYRYVTGDLRAQNPYHGLIPFILEDPELTTAVRRIRVAESVESLSNLIQSSGKHGEITYPFNPEQEAVLMRMQNSIAPLRPLRVVGRNQISAIIEQIRTRLLEWALSLEQAGILGEDMSFTEKEKKKAKRNSEINIQHFQGVLGDVTNSSIEQTMSMTITAGSFDSLSEYLKAHKVTDEDLKELENAVRLDIEPTSRSKLGRKVSEWIGKMIQKAANGSWNIGVGAAGNLLASAISKFYGI